MVRILRDGEAEPSPLLDLGGLHPIVCGGRKLLRLAVPAEHRRPIDAEELARQPADRHHELAVRSPVRDLL